MLGERVHLIGQERGKAAVGRAPLDLDDLAFRQIAAHGVARAHQLARQPVEHLETLDVRRGEARDARGLVAVALLVDERAGIGKVARRILDLAQPGKAFRRLGIRRARDHGERTNRCGSPPKRHLLDSPGRSATVRM